MTLSARSLIGIAEVLLPMIAVAGAAAETRARASALIVRSSGTASVTNAASLTASTGATPSDQFQLHVTTLSGWEDTNKGKSGTIIVKITGTAVAP